MMEHGRGAAAHPLPYAVADSQPSRLLARLVEHIDPDRRLNVLNLGPALPETVEFFSAYRCRLHITDLYRDLPSLVSEEEGEEGDEKGKREEGARESRLDEQLEQALVLPDDTTFDILFFWDVLNYMSRDAISRLMHKLKPHLHGNSNVHCFSVHNTRAPADQQYYGIADAEHLSVRQRLQIPPGYQPHAQSDLLALLRYFEVDRSVLMRDQRTELLLKVRSLQD